eukprot:CAMPEP_0182473854 /NCGR_PEP_ID=MMETSP1319-20130603/24662_1 /TAXON_ID=172717 /ORGANISM="Bolidomonas pacifica, Strain RCC208" /LENGTH=91 /DNA_ID=CAMNT_0024674691 /DNA_START=66 /DNA_END=341 /DNA_ORIENTATION=+
MRLSNGHFEGVFAGDYVVARGREDLFCGDLLDVTSSVLGHKVHHKAVLVAEFDVLLRSVGVRHASCGQDPYDDAFAIPNCDAQEKRGRAAK